MTCCVATPRKNAGSELTNHRHRRRHLLIDDGIVADDVDERAPIRFPALLAFLRSRSSLVAALAASVPDSDEPNVGDMALDTARLVDWHEDDWLIEHLRPFLSEHIIDEWFHALDQPSAKVTNLNLVIRLLNATLLYVWATMDEDENARALGGTHEICTETTQRERRALFLIAPMRAQRHLAADADDAARLHLFGAVSFDLLIERGRQALDQIVVLTTCTRFFAPQCLAIVHRKRPRKISDLRAVLLGDGLLTRWPWVGMDEDSLWRCMQPVEQAIAKLKRYAGARRWRDMRQVVECIHLPAPACEGVEALYGALLWLDDAKLDRIDGEYSWRVKLLQLWWHHRYRQQDSIDVHLLTDIIQHPCID